MFLETQIREIFVCELLSIFLFKFFENLTFFSLGDEDDE